MPTPQRFLVAAGLAVLVGTSGVRPVCAAEGVRDVLDRVGVTRGICVMLGDPTGELAIELARTSERIVYVQLPQAEQVAHTRRAADAAGFHGTRIFVAKGPPSRLHLADNLADVLIALGAAAKMPEAEVLRVLCPGGRALLGARELTKGLLEGTDDWSHPYHGPDNNPQSKDRIARAPYLTQFLAEPRYAPLPQVAVASAGRVFKAFGHVAFKVREHPWLNKLVAFNGFNGTILWQRDLTPGIMVHRNTLIATPSTLYVGDDKSCKLIDTATGALKDEIVPPVELTGGTFWKWMALEDDTLYALVGAQEEKDPTERHYRRTHGWGWKKVSRGHNQPEHRWGFGRTVLAIDPKTKRVLWSHREPELIDSRAVCMRNGRIYIFRFGAFLACLDAKTGKERWRKSRERDPEFFEALGDYKDRQGWQTNWRTTAYLKCSEQALYFAGPQVGKLLAVSADDGRILWEYPFDNFQLVLRDDGLYGISGGLWSQKVSKKFDPLTGRVLAELEIGRRDCARPTGALDAIFFRAQGGTVRLDLPGGEPQLISPMRAQCHDGVTIANGFLYWWPSVCDCNLTLYGLTCLGPAGDFDFARRASEAGRLEKNTADLQVADLPESPVDWPTFRADNARSATTQAVVPTKVSEAWHVLPDHPVTPTAPVTVGGTVFLSGSDGIVRALDVATGKSRWSAFTGACVRVAPTIWRGRAFVGSGDGWVYAFEADTGRLLWRFRAAPVERRIPVYGALLSTWPAASGVLVEDGIAYVAAGIVNYDGTHVYALDAATGRIKWQNNTSGHLLPSARTGVSVQGPLLLHAGKLYMPGGNAVSPAIYDVADGACLNKLDSLKRVESVYPRGEELYRVGDQVKVCGRPFYAHPKYEIYDNTVHNKSFLASTADRDIAWVHNRQLLCFARGEDGHAKPFLEQWGERRISGLEPLWECDARESVALALGKNAVVLANRSEVVAVDLQDGKPLWKQALPCAPVSWGLAIDRQGRILLALEDGSVLCLEQDTRG